MSVRESQGVSSQDAQHFSCPEDCCRQESRQVRNMKTELTSTGRHGERQVSIEPRAWILKMQGENHVKITWGGTWTLSNIIWADFPPWGSRPSGEEWRLELVFKSWPVIDDDDDHNDNYNKSLPATFSVCAFSFATQFCHLLSGACPVNLNRNLPEEYFKHLQLLSPASISHFLSLDRNGFTCFPPAWTPFPAPLVWFGFWPTSREHLWKFYS